MATTFEECHSQQQNILVKHVSSSTVEAMVSSSSPQSSPQELYFASTLVTTTTSPTTTTTTSVKPNDTTTRHWQQWNCPEEMVLAFGANKKAQMAARAMFDLVHQYGDNLREGWMNVLDCLLYFLKADLLPPSLIHLEDFVELSAFASLKQRFKRRPILPKKEESGLLSWLGLTSGSGTGTGGEPTQNRPRSEEEKEQTKLATNVVIDCHPEQIVTDSRYLACSSLTELVNSIIHCTFTVAPVLCVLHGLPPNRQQQHENHQHQQHSQQESQDEDSFVDLSNVAVPPAEMLHKAPSLGGTGEQQPLIRRQMAAASSTLSIESASSEDGGHISPHHASNGPQNGPTVVKLSMEEEEAMVLLLELMTNIVLENRDRLAQVWSPVRDHLRTLLTHFPHNQQLMERAVVSIIRIANRNLFRLGQRHPTTMPTTIVPFSAASSVEKIYHQPIANLGEGQKLSQQPFIVGQNKSVVIVVDPSDDDQQQQQQQSKCKRVEASKESSLPSNQQQQQTLQDLATSCADDVLHFMGTELLALRPPELFLFSRQIAFGLHQLLRANAANLHESEHWEMLFALLESVGAAAYRDEVDGAELVDLPPPHSSLHPPNERAAIFKRGTVVLASNLSRHDPAAFLKVCEILAFLARDAAHITPSNFSQFTHCLRTMVEASLDGGKCAPMKLPPLPTSSSHASSPNTHPSSNQQSSVPNWEHSEHNVATVQQQNDGGEGERTVGEQERLANCYMDASLQLLNICAQLHARAATIHKEWSAAVEKDEVVTENSAVTTAVPQSHNAQRSVPSSPPSALTELWVVYWRPLLQAMVRLSCDCRRRIRAQSLDALGNSFRVPALSELMQPADWEDCFAEVLFPLLDKLLANSPPISPMDPIGMEEARIRAIQFTCKILLSNLTPISRLDSFADLLWYLFDLMDKFLDEGSSCSDLLAEVIQESLKNCLLVCENFGIFCDNLSELHNQLQEKLIALAKKHQNASSSVGSLKLAT